MDNKESKKVPNWKKRILRIKDGKQVKNDDPCDEEASIRILDELVPPSEDDIKTLKKGVRVQFYHYTGETTDGLWLEGDILQRVTKKDEAKRSNFSNNWFNIGKLTLIANLGITADSIPAKISVNLAKNKCWKIASNKPEKNIAKLISSMGTEGRAFHLEANDVVLVENHKDDV